MRIRMRGVSWVLVSCLAAMAAAATPEDDETRDRRWREDLDQLAAELPELHINPFHAVEEVDWRLEVENLKAEVPLLTEQDLLFRLQKLTAMIGDGHTQVLWQRGNVPLSMYPLRLQWFADGLYVTGAPPDRAELVRCRLEGIEGQPIGAIATRLADYLSVDNGVQARRQVAQMILYTQLLQHLGVVAPPPPVEAGQPKPPQTAEFDLRAPNNQPLIAELAPLPSLEGIVWATGLDEEAKPLYLKYTNTPYWAQYLAPAEPAPAQPAPAEAGDPTRDQHGDGAEGDDEAQEPAEPRILFFQYNKCEQREDLPFTEFRRQLWALCDRVEIDRFIIDLRHNGGGDSNILEPFIQELAAREDLNQRGKLFVITGPRTFSSAVLNAISLRKQTRAILIGEPTGGRPNHYGEVKSFTLRHSRLQVTYSTKYFQQVEGDPSTILPDAGVPVPAADYFAGRDTVLEAIKSFGRRVEIDLGEFGAGQESSLRGFGE